MAQEWPIFILLNTLTLQNGVATSKLSCGNCSWHTLTPKPCPGSVWGQQIGWCQNHPRACSDSATVWTLQHQCSGMVPGTGLLTGIGRAETFSLTGRFHWDKNAMVLLFFVFSTQRKNGSSSTQPPWHFLAKFTLLNETCRCEPLSAEEATLPLQPLSPLLTDCFHFYVFFWYASILSS